jgi:Uma2 family endonuclease
MASLGTVRELISAEDPVPATMSQDLYLRTIFHPDCDFVDGRIEERNVGEYEHSMVQKMLMRLLGDREREWGVLCVPECRLQVAATRCRVPDVMVLRGGKKYSGVIQDAPLLCVEVLSPEDTWARMRERLDDYLRMGVEHVWCFEPEAREVRRYTTKGFDRVTESELTIPGTPIRITVAQVFSALDQD